MVYDPLEAKKSYAQLLKDNGTSGAVKAVVFAVIWYGFSKFVFKQDLNLAVMVICYFFFAAYYTWKPKFIRFLRGVLRGEKYRNKAD